MANSKFDKLKNKGALEIVDSSISNEIKEENKSNDGEEKFLRSYSLTKSQLRMLQLKKLDEEGTLSDIVGRAIEMYCSK